MNSELLRAENRAIDELEHILLRAGWADGWELTDDEVRKAISPLFYRNQTSTVAEEARVTIDGQTHSLYVIYSMADTNPLYSGNKPYRTDVSIALTFYYDDPFLFYEGHSSSPFAKFVDLLLAEFETNAWSVYGEGESQIPSGDDSKTYTNRKVLFVTKNF